MRYLAALLGLGALLLALAYANGWRLPGPDRHPDWPQFPHLTNPRLVVAEVPDFARRYGHRYHLPAAIEDPEYAILYEEYYRTNLRNVRALGFQRTHNEVVWRKLHLNFNGNDPGRDSPPSPPLVRMRPAGYEYLEVRLAGVAGYFKGKVYENEDFLPYFYQYNYPAAATDTLFLRYGSTDYRVILR